MLYFGICSVSKPESMHSISLPTLRGRGTHSNPPNRFERLHVDRSGWQDPDDPAPQTVLLG